MKISFSFGVAVLALAALATNCATNASQPASSGEVYLVGVTGGG
jgi:hypothetical protein